MKVWCHRTKATRKHSYLRREFILNRIINQIMQSAHFTNQNFVLSYSTVVKLWGERWGNRLSSTQRSVWDSEQEPLGPIRAALQQRTADVVPSTRPSATVPATSILSNLHIWESVWLDYTLHLNGALLSAAAGQRLLDSDAQKLKQLFLETIDLDSAGTSGAGRRLLTNCHALSHSSAARCGCQKSRNRVFLSVRAEAFQAVNI